MIIHILKAMLILREEKENISKRKTRNILNDRFNHRIILMNFLK